MVYILDDNWDTERMVIRAGSAAFGLYVRCGMWCARQGTDGVIPSAIASGYGSPEWIGKLLDAKLWEAHADGYLDLHFLKRNPTAEKAAVRRQQKADRQQRWLENQGKRRAKRASKDASQGASQDASRDGLHLLSLKGEMERGGRPADAAPTPGEEDPAVVEADQRRLIALAANAESERLEAEDRARRGAAAARAAIRRKGTA